MKKIPLEYKQVIVYDIETAGVNALNADLGYIITFGYISLYDFLVGKKGKTISIADFPKEFKKDPHNDKQIVKAACEILRNARVIIHHYGNRFDHPYIQTRALIHDIESYDCNIPQVDTCFLAYKKLKLSSNRLANIAKVLNCKYRKIDKKDGWPTWWMAYLKGSTKYDKQMRHYCLYDVLTLAEISLRMRQFWAKSIENALFSNKEKRCRACGSDQLLRRGNSLSGGKPVIRYGCKVCKRYTNIKA